MILSRMFKELLRRGTVFSVWKRKSVGLAIALSLVWIVIGGSVASAESFLLTWGSFGSADGQFSSPFGVAVQGDEVFTVDFNHRAQVFDRTGTFLRKWGSFGSGDGEFMFPVGVAVSGEEVYVADSANNRVEVFDRNGTFLRKFGSFGSGGGQFDGPVGVAVQGPEVFVTDAHNHRLEVFDRNGTFLRTWGSFGSEDGQFLFTAGVTVQSNEVYVVDYNDQNYPTSLGDRVEVFDRNGTFLRTFGSFGSGDGQFNGPFGVAVEGSEVFVVDRFNNRVQVFVRH